MARSLTQPDTKTYSGRFAARLRELRTRKYGTQSLFREALESRGLIVTPQTLSGWETGYRTPDLDSLPILADALGVKVRKLLPDK